MGGIVGTLSGGTIDQCSVNNLTLTSSGNNFGGLVGFFCNNYFSRPGLVVYSAYVTNSYVINSTINGGDGEGGLIGTIQLNSSSYYAYVTNCYSSTNIKLSGSAYWRTQPFIGFLNEIGTNGNLNNFIFTNCFADTGASNSTLC